MTDITDTDDSEGGANRLRVAYLGRSFRNHPIILTEQGPFELFGHACLRAPNRSWWSLIAGAGASFRATPTCMIRMSYRRGGRDSCFC